MSDTNGKKDGILADGYVDDTEIVEPIQLGGLFLNQSSSMAFDEMLKSVKNFRDGKIKIGNNRQRIARHDLM